MHLALHRSLILISLLGACALADPTAKATRLLGIVGPAGESSIAFDTNAAGQVAGVLKDEAGRQRGVLFEKGVLTDLGTGAGMYSEAKAIMRTEKSPLAGS
ncbi:MAG: hypothetical protein V4631_23200 [Pseudomonadota bacterium]